MVMTYKRFLLISKIPKTIGCLLLAACFLIPLSSTITLKSDGTTKTYSTAYSFIFGGTISTTNITYKAHSVSGIGIAYFALMLASICALLSSFFIKDGKKGLSKWLTFGSGISSIAFSILALCSHKSFSNILADALIDGHSESVSKTIFNNTTMQFGVWGVAIFGFIAAFLILASLLFDGTFDKVRAKVGII